jgi:hypothetical protein
MKLERGVCGGGASETVKWTNAGPAGPKPGLKIFAFGSENIKRLKVV